MNNEPGIRTDDASALSELSRLNEILGDPTSKDEDVQAALLAMGGAVCAVVDESERRAAQVNQEIRGLLGHAE
jgi:hypothetical protein